MTRLLAALTSGTPQISYAELSQLLMAAVAVMVGVFALAITIIGTALGFWGYLSIKNGAIARAEKAIATRLKEYFDGEDLSEKIKTVIRERVASEGDGVWADMMVMAGFSKGEADIKQKRLAPKLPPRKKGG